MTIDQASHPQPKYEDPPATLAVQDQNQEGRKELEEDFILQIARRAKEEWEAFHPQHPDIDEETFVEAQRFCIKQWFLQHGTSLADLPAFERAEEHFAYEVQQWAEHIQAILELMADPIYSQAQWLGAFIATRAQERSQQAHEAGKKMSTNQAYLMGKIHQLRAPEQAQEREQEAQQRRQEVRQDIDYLKASGIVLFYESQKEALRQREQAMLSMLRQLLEENPHQIAAPTNILKCEEYIINIDILLKDIYLKMLDMYGVCDTVGTVFDDWEAVSQRAKHARSQTETVQEFISALQEDIKDALAKAQAKITPIRNARHALERMQKRSTEIEQWAQEEKQQAQERKKHIKTIDLARSKTNEAVKQLAGISTCLYDIKESYLKIAENGVKCTKYLEKCEYALKQAFRAAEKSAREAQKAFDQQSVARALPIESNSSPCQKQLIPGEDTVHTEVRARQAAMRMEIRARQAAREELEAYAQARKYGEDALRYLQDIVAEYSNLQERTGMAMKHFTDLLEGFFPFEQDVLDRAITGVKQIVKTSMQVLRAEEQAKEAAHQMTTAIETGPAINTARFLASEQEALLLAALANDALTAHATSYCTSHMLAEYIAQENLQIQLEASMEQFLSALEVVKNEVHEIKHQKECKDRERQAEAPGDCLRQAHLLINEQTGVLTLKDEEATFLPQDLARMTAEGQVTWLSLPNGTHIAVADIDVEQTTYDPTQLERGITITLKQDEQRPNTRRAHGGPQQINLLAAAWVMTTSLTPDALRELMDRNLDERFHRLTSAIEAKDLNAIEDCFNTIRLYDIYKSHIDTYIIPFKERKKLQQDLDEWMKGVAHAADSIADAVRTYAYEALDSECAEKEITEAYVLKNGLSIDEPYELYCNRVACFQKIAEGRGLDTIITCELFQDPDDPSAGTYSSPTVQELLLEYERAAACHVLERREKRASDKWVHYLARLRRAILDQAPLFFCAQFLADQVKQAVQAGRWEEGTAENPGIPHLAQELEALGQQDYPQDNEYTSSVHVFIQRVAAGLQRALEIENPSDILAKVSLLDLALAALHQIEEKVLEALDPITPTALARQLVEQIGTRRGSGTQDHEISKEKRDKE